MKEKGRYEIGDVYTTPVGNVWLVITDETSYEEALHLNLKTGITRWISTMVNTNEKLLFETVSFAPERP